MKRMRLLLALIISGTLLLATGCSGEPALPTEATVRVMSWNVLNPSWGGGPVDGRRQDFVNTVTEEAPDILGVQEASSPWHEVFDTLPASYAAVGDITNSGADCMTMFLYNTDTLTLLDNGMIDLDAQSNIRVVTWAVFQVNNTAVSFLITNTHPDSREAACLTHTKDYLDIAAALQEEHGLPLLSVGDFNATEDSHPYRLHIADGFTDSKYADGVELLSDVDSYLQGDYGGTVSIGLGSRDHIFFKGDITPLTFETLCEGGVLTVSDHLPIIADMSIQAIE